MNTLTTNMTGVQSVTQEINDILKQFNDAEVNATGEKQITTNSGRTYKTAIVIEEHEGVWKITNLISKGMFRCNECDSTPKLYNGDNWYQFKFGENVVRMHDSLIHLFQNHPEKVPAIVTKDSLTKINLVFLS